MLFCQTARRYRRHETFSGLIIDPGTATLASIIKGHYCIRRLLPRCAATTCITIHYHREDRMSTRKFYLYLFYMGYSLLLFAGKQHCNYAWYSVY